MFTVKFKITNLTCEACVKLSQMILGKIADVTDSKVDLKTGEAEISATRVVGQNEIANALEEVNKIVSF